MARAWWLAGAPIRAALVGAILVYRFTLSGVLGGQCRFYPTCSHYGEEAIRTHGAVKGVGMTAWRLLRCQPFSRGGIDHVPPRRRRATRHDMYENVTHSEVGAA